MPGRIGIMPGLNRRGFIKSAGVTAGSLLIADASKAAANERIRHAVIGVGGQGGNHCKRFSSNKDLCEVVAVCDVDSGSPE